MMLSRPIHRTKAALLCAAALLCLSACQRRDDVPGPDPSRSAQPDMQASAPLPQTPASSASAVP
ncbi:hypothetical protein H5407_20650 [Mitsuaria sp. WAJ17]|uniref:hypothetical protein n=1 Tax=Mitsuaria sp. WAJ17 TaxID=2761452 RepID=UPI0015FF5A51|nr:hypothetical protein [Mitsuaria sp. WAJ17]MBB2487653.1 hypothetical protein [Mitsuaria sp. WAJ17]